MSGQTEEISISEVSATYAGFAAVFRYPKTDTGYFSQSEYLAAFDKGVSDTAVSLFEASYVDIDTSALFEELVRFYEYFGLQRNTDAELPDHLAVEFEYMHFLCELEHHAEMNNQDTTSIRNAQRDFLDRHVIRLLAGLSKALENREGPAGELVQTCIEFIKVHRQLLSEIEPVKLFH